jgi:hypothetical protein
MTRAPSSSRVQTPPSSWQRRFAWTAAALLSAAGCSEPEVGIEAHKQAVSTSSVGTFTALPTNPVYTFGETLFLLSDGTVLSSGANFDRHYWTRFTPDSKGNYLNGTWSVAASSIRGRQYFLEFMQPDGRLWIGGGERIQDPDGNTNATEVFDPVANTWTAGPDGITGNILDTGAAQLADGRLLIAHPGNASVQIFNPATNLFSLAASMINDSGRESNWQLLGDGSVLAPTRNSQRYLPGTNQWVATAVPPITLDTNDEQGPLVLLQTGKVIAWSDVEKAAIYTPPTTLTGPGSWVTAASITGNNFAADVPASILPDGKVLIEGTAGKFGPGSFFEYDPNTDTYAPITGVTSPGQGFTQRFLVLPTGQVMMSGTTGFFLYTPTGTPDPTWRPVINSVNSNGDGTFTLTGTQLNGRTWGAVYGDDAMMSSNYPIVYVKDALDNVTFMRSYDFSSMGVRTGSTVVSAKFQPPPSLLSGTYNLFVSAVGISNATPVVFNYTATTSGVTAPVADAYVREGSFSNSNFGSETTLQVKNTSAVDNKRRTFLRFDVSSFSGTVTGARLRLYGNHTMSTTQDSAFAVASNTWTESGVTWNNQPALGAKQGNSVTVTTTAQYREWDVTAFVASQKAMGINLVSLGVTMDAQTNNAPDTFNSRENAANQPQLVVTTTRAGTPPTVATAASATPTPVAANTTAVSVLGADDGGEPALTYTWAATGNPAGPVSFSANGTNAAKSSTATFTKAGPYNLQVTIRDAGGLTVTSSVIVMVSRTVTNVTITPTTAAILTGETQNFVATAFDQFGTAIVAPLFPPPPFAWSTTGGGTVANGAYVAGTTPGGPFTVTATAGGVSANATISVLAPTITTLSPTADAYVRDGSAGTNFGHDTTLQVKDQPGSGNTRRSFLRFDLSSLTGKVRTATLRLFGNHTMGSTFDVCEAVPSNTWSETGITWNNQPPRTDFLAATEITTTAQYYEWDVSFLIDGQLTAGISQASMALTLEQPTNNAPDTFNSREASTNRPQLVVVTGP